MQPQKSLVQDLKARFACKHLHLVVKTEEEEEEEQEATPQDLKLILAQKLFPSQELGLEPDQDPENSKLNKNAEQNLGE
ncbi:unnamed protein product [Sphagnum balticum]